ncbi:MAG: PTS sugar transporter subunit IIA [Candidatus Pelethousia sp.]|nr:PTS sugar transporter subunit IIA [Candidatus Pelethousia sp.]
MQSALWNATLTNRMLSILSNSIKSGQNLKVTDLANLYGVSPRVIYYDLEGIGEFAAKEKLPIALAIGDGAVRCSLLQGDASWADGLNRRYAEEALLTPEERVEEILLRLLREERLRIASLMEDLRVSKSTIVSDMEVLKKQFSKYRVTLAAQTDGFSLVGDESDIRLASTDELQRLMQVGNLLSRMHIELGIWERRPHHRLAECFPFEPIEEAVKNALAQTGFSYKQINSCILCAWICLLRGAAGKTATPHPQDWASLEGTDVQKAARSITNSLPAGKDATGTEWALGLTLLGGRADYRSVLYLNQNIDLKVLAASFAAEVCASIGARASGQLLHEIKNELFQILIRRDVGLRIYDDRIILSLRGEYDALYRIVEKSAASIEKAFGMKLSESQLIYLLLCFVELYENRPQNEQIPRVLVVCNSGTVVSRLMSNKLQMSLNISIEDVVSAYELNEYLKSHSVDHVISTVPLITPNVPCLLVDPMLTKSDWESLRSLFPMKRAKFSIADTFADTPGRSGALVNRLSYASQVDSGVARPKEQAVGTLFRLTDEACILLGERYESLEAAVRASGECLHESGFVEAGYIGALVQAVERGGRFMLIGPDILIPHSLAGCHVKRTGISVVRPAEPLLLRDCEEMLPIRWLFTLCTIDKTSHIAALAQLAQLLGDEAKMERMIRANTPGDIRAIFLAMNESSN